MNWDNAENFIRKLPFYLWNALRYFSCLLFKQVKEFFTAKFWRQFLELATEIKKLFGPIYKHSKPRFKQWLDEVFKNEKRKKQPIPFKQGFLKSPGAATYNDFVMRLILAGVLLGMLIGVVISMLLSLEQFGVVVSVISLWILLMILFIKADHYFLGYLGECAVAEELEKYGRDPNWRVFHSFFIPGFEFDIDHIVVCSSGIFCVETKTLRRADKITIQDGEIFDNGKKYKDKYNKDPKGRTKLSALNLHNYLTEKCSPGGRFPYEVPRVFPVIIFTGASVEKYISIESGQELIVGNSESIKEIFEEVGQKQGGKADAPVLKTKDIEKISKVLEKESRSDIETVREILS